MRCITAIILALAGCASAKLGGPAPRLVVNVTALGAVCATETLGGHTDANGVRHPGTLYRPVQVFVHLQGLEPSPVTVTVRGVEPVRFAPTTHARVDFKAEVGGHLVTVDAAGFHAQRAFGVYDCRGGR